MTSDEILELTEIIGGVVEGSKTRGLFPVSRSTWFRGIKSGIYPKPIRLSPRRVGWRRSDIEKLIARLEVQRGLSLALESDLK